MVGNGFRRRSHLGGLKLLLFLFGFVGRYALRCKIDNHEIVIIHDCVAASAIVIADTSSIDLLSS